MTDTNALRVRLLEAINNGEAILVRYNAGDQPGTIREVVPEEFEGADRIHVDCFSSGDGILMNLADIEVIDSTDLSLVDYISPDDQEEMDLLDLNDDGEYIDIEPPAKKTPWQKTKLFLKWIAIGYLLLVLILVLYSFIDAFSSQ